MIGKNPLILYIFKTLEDNNDNYFIVTVVSFGVQSVNLRRKNNTEENTFLGELEIKKT